MALVVDDGELLGATALVDALEAFIRQARDTGSVLIAAATTEDVLANRTAAGSPPYGGRARGLLLNPSSHVDGEVFGLRLPRSLSGGWPAGRALLVRRGEITPAQLILQVNSYSGPTV